MFGKQLVTGYNKANRAANIKIMKCFFVILCCKKSYNKNKCCIIGLLYTLYYKIYRIIVWPKI